MISGLPAQPLPDWLAALDPDTAAEKPFPLSEVLRGSLYYPSSRFDGDPVRHLGGNFHSFVYVDYGPTEGELEGALTPSGFSGYGKLFKRAVREQELTPNGWVPQVVFPEDGDPRRGRFDPKSGFCNWYVFEREEGRSPDHGPYRFSLLYLCADGAAAYQALYVSNHCHPEAIAVIQPGQAFGGNWADFTDPRGILARTVMRNPYGRPGVLLYGGYGSRRSYERVCWPAYERNVGYLEKTNEGNLGSIGVWVADQAAS